jgi:hypothetical protein
MILASSNADEKVRAIAVKDLLNSISKELVDPTELVIHIGICTFLKPNVNIARNLFTLLC